MTFKPFYFLIYSFSSSACEESHECKSLKIAMSRRAYQTSTRRCRSSSTGSSLQPQPTVAWPPAQTPGRLEGRPLGWVSKEGTWADAGNAWTKTAEGSLSI